MEYYGKNKQDWITRIVPTENQIDGVSCGVFAMYNAKSVCTGYNHIISLIKKRRCDTIIGFDKYIQRFNLIQPSLMNSNEEHGTIVTCARAYQQKLLMLFQEKHAIRASRLYFSRRISLAMLEVQTSP